jgi:beta-N-acetylhexosaminidase
MSKPSAHVGQHLFVGIPGKELTPATRRFLNDLQPGGVILFARNVGTAGELRALGRALRTELKHRPLVAMDQENGRVNRLREIAGELPTIADLKREGAVEKVEEFGRNIGRWLHQFCVDIDFAPVFDLELAVADNALRDRCWGRTADEVIQWAGAFLEGLEREGVAGCPKHFPGLGGATFDSHDKLPTINRSRENMLRHDVEPYRHFMRRLTAVMVGHGLYPALDTQPASLSRMVIGDLLRRQLGFAGLVLTDDLEMGAITDFREAVVEAFGAGADMLLVCHTPEKMYAAHEALSKAKISRERFAESQKRIQQFRDQWIGHKV